jgi:hypothetical protein
MIEPLLLPSALQESSENLSDNISNSIVLFSRCQYGSDQPWVSETQDEHYIYPVVHSTPKAGPRILWSSKINIDSNKTHEQYERIPMFGVPKVIFGESGIHDVIVDIDGKYGMTQGAIGLKILQDADKPSGFLEEEGLRMKRVLESPTFATITDAMSFSNFRIDWRMFLYFHREFYKKIQ